MDGESHRVFYELALEAALEVRQLHSCHILLVREVIKVAQVRGDGTKTSPLDGGL